jgi:hypothetical protein
MFVSLARREREHSVRDGNAAARRQHMDAISRKARPQFTDRFNASRRRSNPHHDQVRRRPIRRAPGFLPRFCTMNGLFWGGPHDDILFAYGSLSGV